MYTRQINGNMEKIGVNHPARSAVFAAVEGNNRKDGENTNKIKSMTD